MHNMFISALTEIWNGIQMIFLYGLAGLTIITVIYFFYRLEMEVRMDKEKKKK